LTEDGNVEDQRAGCAASIDGNPAASQDRPKSTNCRPLVPVMDAAADASNRILPVRSWNEMADEEGTFEGRATFLVDTLTRIDAL
jgi:hypothetical protein